MIAVLAVMLALGLCGCGDDDGGGSNNQNLGPTLPMMETGWVGGWTLDNSTDITPVITASRTSGVAPLAVYFDATTTDLGSHSYVDATFAWTFDADDADPAARYRHASGFVAAHVFTEPGTYRVRLDVWDPDRLHGFAEVTVEVLPFEGTTVHVAAHGDDENPGTVDQPLATLEHALATYGVANTQILLRRGDTFEVSSPGAEGPGPVILGAYSDPAAPSEDKPVIHSTDVDGTWSVLRFSTQDWRIMDLVIESGGLTSGDAGPRYPGGIELRDDSAHNLLYRLELRQLGTTMVGLYGDANTIAECEMHHFGRYGVYSSGDANGRHAVMGNYVHHIISDHAEHVLRFQGVQGVFVAFNDLRATDTKSNVQFRGNTRDVVLLANVLDRSSGLQPQNDDNAEYVSHAVAEANLFIGRTDPGYENGFTVRQQALGIKGTDIVVRNNVFYNYGNALGISDHPLVGASRDVRFINNTMLCIVPDCRLLAVCETCTGVTVANNILYNDSPEEPYIYDIFLQLSGPNESVTSDHNLLFGQGWGAEHEAFHLAEQWVTLPQWQAASGQDQATRLVDPLIPGVDLESADLARPDAASPAVDAGASHGVWLDYYGRLRDSSPDIGAVEVSP